MALAAGFRLGPYEVVSPAGAGGMGEVYRARDTRLDRTVAIKILPTALAGDPQLRERFDREARAISALNHPHICTLYDVGHQSGTDYLVLEYLEGETLSDRLARVAAPAQPSVAAGGSKGPGLPTSDALAIAIQIAGALDTAHRAGIVHRDLKPANVMLTKAGAKLLDFGLAKTAAPVIATSGLSMAPTTPPNLTAQGTILGTFQYMAPEQIEGLEADARTDIFAFGAVLFEMLTGRPAFEGTTRAQLLGAILKDEPPPVSSGQPQVPKALDRIVGTCLAKDSDDRWQTARDLLRELKWVADGGASAERAESPVARRRDGRRSRIAWAAAGLLTLALAAVAVPAIRHLRETPEVARAISFTVPWPENTQFGGQLLGFAGSYTAQHAISPDGRHIAMVAQTGGKDSLWLRTVATLGIRELPGTDDASMPFWSADSRFVAFFAGGKLKKVQITGGPSVVLCDAPQAAGGSWNRDNVIVFATSAKPLHRVSSAGGTPVALTQLDRTYGETSHRWPHFLPDHRHFAFTAVTGGADIAPKPSVVKIGSLDSTDAVALFNAESAVAYADGHLLFLAGDSLMAQPFDPGMRQFTGDPFPVAEDVDRSGSRYASFSVSPGGTLVYAHDVWNASVLQWFDRSGQPLGQVGEPADYQHVSLSPDERRVAAAIGTGLPGNVGRNIDIWTIDVARNVTSRLTSGPTRENTPVWSPDSLRVLFSSTQGQADVGLHQKVWTGASEEEVVLKGDRGRREFLFASDWSPDGRSIVYSLSSGSPGQGDIWILPLFGDRNRSHSCRAPVGTTTGRSHPMASGSRIPPSMAIRRRSLCSPSRRHAPELRCRETAACSRSGEAMARSGEAMAKSCTSWPRTAA